MRYYRLAQGATWSSGAEWPYYVDICFDGVSHPVGLSQGKCHGSAGGNFTAVEALESGWNEHFKCAGGEWLRPYLARMAAGKKVSAEEVVARYAARHGEQPESYGLTELSGGGWLVERKEGSR